MYGETVNPDSELGSGYTSDVVLRINFTNSKVSGSVSPANYSDGTTATFGLNIDEAAITGNTFATTLSVDTTTCTDCPTISTSEVDGTFFGPEGQQVGGTYNHTGTTADGEEYMDVGAFAVSDTGLGAGQ